MHINGNKYIFSEKEKKHIINEYENGKFLKNIAEYYKISVRPIKKVLLKNDIEIRKKRRYYNVNHDYFNAIDTEDKAYWLGFILADGSLAKPNKIKISLSNLDRDHLNKFLFCLNSNYNIHDYGSMSEVVITSDSIFSDLNRNNIHINKVHNIKIPKIKSDILSHFWRGVFDGDGALFFQRKSWILSLTGAKNTIISFKDFAQKHSYAKSKIFNKHNSFCFKTTGNKITPILAEKLYKDANIYLDRKYEKYLEMCEFLEKRR